MGEAIDGRALTGRDAEIYAQALVDGASPLCGFGGQLRADAVLCDGPTGDFWLSVSADVAWAARVRVLEGELAHARTYGSPFVDDYADALAKARYARRKAREGGRCRLASASSNAM